MHDGVFIGKDGVPPRSDEVHLYPFAGLELLAAAGPSGPPYAGGTRDHSTLLDIKFQKALSVLGSAWNPGVGLLRKQIRSAIFEPEIDVFVRSSSGGAKCDRNTLESIYTN